MTGCSLVEASSARATMSPTEGGSLHFFFLEAFRDDVDGPAAIPSADEACVAERSTANATLSDDVLLS